MPFIVKIASIFGCEPFVKWRIQLFVAAVYRIAVNHFTTTIELLIRISEIILLQNVDFPNTMFICRNQAEISIDTPRMRAEREKCDLNLYMKYHHHHYQH